MKIVTWQQATREGSKRVAQATLQFNTVDQKHSDRNLLLTDVV